MEVGFKSAEPILGVRSTGAMRRVNLLGFFREKKCEKYLGGKARRDIAGIIVIRLMKIGLKSGKPIVEV